jgi:carbonic anhydrase
MQDAWARGQSVAVHGWVYALTDGLLRDLGFCAMTADEVSAAYDDALEALCTRAP